MSRKVSEATMEYIKSEIEKIEYGRVIIELTGRNDKMDVISENRKRIEHEKKVHEPTKHISLGR